MSRTAGRGNHEGDLIAPYVAEIRPTATGRRASLAKGLRNPLVPEYTVSPSAKPG